MRVADWAGLERNVPDSRMPPTVTRRPVQDRSRNRGIAERAAVTGSTSGNRAQALERRSQAPGRANPSAATAMRSAATRARPAARRLSGPARRRATHSTPRPLTAADLRPAATPGGTASTGTRVEAAAVVSTAVVAHPTPAVGAAHLMPAVVADPTGVAVDRTAAADTAKFPRAGPKGPARLRFQRLSKRPGRRSLTARTPSL